MLCTNNKECFRDIGTVIGGKYALYGYLAFLIDVNRVGYL